MVMGVGAHERAATMLGRALPCAAHVWPCRDREDSLRWPCNAVITVQLELAEPYYVSLTVVSWCSYWAMFFSPEPTRGYTKYETYIQGKHFCF